MTDKIVLTNLANLQNETTAVNAINSNNAVIVAAFDNTLSRDGTSPNQMGANLDMNSNRILNLQDAISAQEPATLHQLSTIAGGGTIIIPSLPTGGATGTVLKKNSATNFDASFGAMGAAGMPALTGAVTSSVGTVATTLATAPAFTLKGNNTSGTASPTDISITTLTAKTVPLGTDLVVISDEAAAHAFKKSTIAQVIATNAVATIAGQVGTITLSGGLTNSGTVLQLANNGAASSGGIADPTGTTSVSGVMMGLGASAHITPVFSSRVLLNITGFLSNTGTGITQAQLRWGTGAAPVNGVATTGTLVSQTQSSGVAAGAYPASMQAVVTGLTPGTAYWFDIALIAGSGTATIKTVFTTSYEF